MMSIMTTEAAYYFGSIIIYFVVLYGLWKFRDRSFLSTDIKPKIFPLTQLKIQGDSSKLVFVKTGIHIEDFPIFNMNANQFTVNAIVWFKFNPYIISINAIEQFNFFKTTGPISKTLIETSLIGQDLLVQYKVQLRFSSNINHDFFPMNDHCLYLIMTNHYLTTEEMVFDIDTKSIEMSNNLIIEDWNVAGINVESGYSIISTNQQASKLTNHPSLLLTINLKKSGLRKIALIIMPIFIILFINSTSMLPMIAYQGHNVSLVIGCLTGILAYRYVISQNGPKVGYFTLAEHIYNFSLSLIIITFILVVFRTSNSHFLGYDFGHTWFWTVKILSIAVNIYLLYFFKKFTPETSHKKLKLVKSLPLYRFKKISLSQLEYLLRWQSRKWRFFLNGLDHTKNYHFPKNITIQQESKVVLFIHLNGDTTIILQHLKQLIKQGILDHQLKICSKHNYIIFQETKINTIDDLINLFLIQIILLLNNPGQVFIIEDLNVIRRAWYAHDEALKNRRYYRKYGDFLMESIERFFIQLPSTICLEHPHHPTEKIYCTLDSPEYFLDTNQEKPTNKSLEPTAFFCGLDTNHYFQSKANLLQTLISNKLIWKICSYRPEQVGFAILHFSPNYFSTLEWYTKINTNLHQSYQKHRFHTIYGYEQPLKQKKTTREKKEIIIVSTMDFTGSSSFLSKQIMNGIRTSFIHYNAHKNIHGRKIRLVALNDNYNPTMAKTNAEFFAQNKLHKKILLSPVGSPTLEAYGDLILQKKLLVLFPISGSDRFRHPNYENIVFFRPSMAAEGLLLLNHALNVNKTSRLAIFCQNDAFGLGALNSIKMLLDQSGIEWLPIYYERHNPLINKAAKELISFNPDTMFFFSTAVPSLNLIHTLGIQLISSLNLYAISYAAYKIHDFLNSIGIPMTRTHFIPSLNSDLPIVKEFLGLMQSELLSSHVISPESLEGYINACLLNDILSSVGKELRHEAILEKITSYQNVNYKGLTLNFNPETREIYHQVWIDT